MMLLVSHFDRVDTHHMTPTTIPHTHHAPRLDTWQFRAAMGPGLQVSAVTEAVLRTASRSR